MDVVLASRLSQAQIASVLAVYGKKGEFLGTSVRLLPILVQTNEQPGMCIIFIDSEIMAFIEKH